jgi:hypothetical protein
MSSKRPPETLRNWLKDERNVAEFIEFAILHAAVMDRLKLGQLLEDLASRRGSEIVALRMLADEIRDIEMHSPRVVVPMPPRLRRRPSDLRRPRCCNTSSPLPPASRSFAPAPGCFGRFSTWRLRWAIRPLHKTTPAPPKVVAQLVASFDAQWPEGVRRRRGERFVERSRLNLLSGSAYLRSTAGALIVVEGPSDFELVDSVAMNLRHGKAAIRIDGAAESFLVNTPTVQVVDLGTEFGVDADPSGATQVMVFDGSVALGEAEHARLPGADRRSRPLRELDAGLQLSVDPTEASAISSATATPVENPRHFMRPDEVDVRLRALAGSSLDQKLAAHYARSRIEGLLAFQGFDADSSGRDFALGVGAQGLRSDADMKFVPPHGEQFGGIEVRGGPVYLSLDTLPGSAAARAGLVNEQGRIGRSGTEIWLTWRMQRLIADGQNPGSAGVSLMIGQRSDLDEPMFFGRAFGHNEGLVLQSAWGAAPPPEGARVTASANPDGLAERVADRPFDDLPHTWLARVEFRDGPDRVSVWVDADWSTLDPARPLGVLDSADVAFDRIRFAANRGGETWRFGQFAMALSPRALEQLNHAAGFHLDE